MSQKYDYPTKIKLPEGQCSLIVSPSDGELIEKDITIVGNQFEVIRIE